MRIIRNIYGPCHIESPVVALGNFDGIHKGHQALIYQTVKIAKKIKGTSVLFTFYPHPLKIIKNVDEPFLIQTFKEKVKIAENLGIQVIVCARFTKNFAIMEPEKFIKEILIDIFHTKAICVGHDYTFGKNGSGTIKNLREYSNRYNFKLIVIPPIKINGIVVSSTKIREFLRNGQIDLANKLLGRNYTVSGIVKEGDRRGTTLGFPTANIYPMNEILLPSGVYAAYVYINSRKYMAAVNVGTNPTFKGNIKHIEAHLLDFKGNLYNKKITIEFISFIREEKKFRKIDDLIKQIKLDISEINKRLKQ